MTEHQRLFLVQARSNFDVFQHLADSGFPKSHALHYLQMATECLAKAFKWRSGPPEKNTHVAFVNLWKNLRTNRRVQGAFGCSRKNEKWTQIIRESVKLAEKIEKLAPALAQNGPNPEYPWPQEAPKHVPVEFQFPLWNQLQDTASGRRFMTHTKRLLNEAEQFLC